MERAWDLISKALEEQKAAKTQNGNVTQKPQGDASSTQNGTKRKPEDENEDPSKKKKNKPSDDANSSLDKTCDQSSCVDDDSKNSSKVKWCTIAKMILRGLEDKELPLKKFQKKIIPEYLNRAGDKIGDATVEVLWANCLKKLSKNPKFKILKEKIKLIS